jgi:L-ascorbate metabolism protein UlaG (beta-lactamase superfamily)
MIKKSSGLYSSSEKKPIITRNMIRNSKNILKSLCILGMFICQGVGAFASVGPDTFAIYSLGHGSLYFEYKNLIIHVDPNSSQADYNLLPDANLIFITHSHTDHYDLSALNKIKTDSTTMVCTQEVNNIGTYAGTAIVMNNGDSMIVQGIPVKAVPAYNIVSTTIYHPKGTGNGYVLTFGEKRVYIAGDTENIPEMDSLGKIDIAFLPMNLPYTMSVTMAADAAGKVKPDILYIYHFGNSDTASLRSLLSNQDMEIRMGKSVHYESGTRNPELPNSLKINTENKTVFYPNPVKDYLTIYNPYPGSSLSLYDLAGHVLMKQHLNYEGEQLIDMRSYKPGMYVIKFQDKKLVKSKLLLKE